MGNDPKAASGGMFGRPSAPDEFGLATNTGDVNDVFMRAMPRTGYYVRPADTLRLHCTSKNINGFFFMNYRIVRPDGMVVNAQETINVSGSFGGGASVNLPEGWLVGVSIENRVANIPDGWCYAQVFLAQGLDNDDQNIVTLIGGYLNSFYSLGWPGTPTKLPTEGRGVPVFTAVGNPAAGVEWAATLSQSFRHRLVGITCKLTTSAVAGNRNVTIAWNNGVSNIGSTTANLNQITGTGITYSFGVGMQFSNIPAVNAYGPLPDFLEFGCDGALSIGSVTAGLLAGDQWSNIVVSTIDWHEND